MNVKEHVKCPNPCHCNNYLALVDSHLTNCTVGGETPSDAPAEASLSDDEERSRAYNACST